MSASTTGQVLVRTPGGQNPRFQPREGARSGRLTFKGDGDAVSTPDRDMHEVALDQRNDYTSVRIKKRPVQPYQRDAQQKYCTEAGLNKKPERYPE